MTNPPAGRETAKIVLPPWQGVRVQSGRRARERREAFDYVGLARAAYDLAEGSDEAWLTRIVERAAPVLDQGFGVFGIRWGLDRTDLGSSLSVFVGCSSTMPETMWRASSLCPPEELLDSLRAGPVVFNSRVFTRHGPYDERPDVKLVLAREGSRDVLRIQATFLDWTGWLIGVPVRNAAEIPARRLSALARVAAHLTAGARLRAARSAHVGEPSSLPDAVFDERGRLVHASDVVVKSAKSASAMRRAAHVFELARGRLARSDPDRALELWRALVQGRWSLVEHRDSDGKRLLLARKNADKLRDPSGLTPIEQQVAGYAALGHTIKFIAYELGLASATVSHHLNSVLRKLGLQSRAELVVLFGTKPDRP